QRAVREGEPPADADPAPERLDLAEEAARRLSRGGRWRAVPGGRAGGRGRDLDAVGAGAQRGGHPLPPARRLPGRIAGTRRGRLVPGPSGIRLARFGHEATSKREKRETFIG